MSDFEVLTPGGHQHLIEKIGERLDLKADTDGYYSQLTAGLAENLIGRGDAVPEEYLYQTAGGTDDISDGIATIDCIKGNTLVWNQIFNPHPRTITSKGVTFTIDSNGKCTLSGTATGAETFTASSMVTIESGHKYLCIGGNSERGVTLYTPVLSGTAGIEIRTATYTARSTCSVGIAASFSGTYELYPQLFDLTLMFGAGNEPETVEEFEAMFPLPYYPYSAPKLLNVDMRGVETVGFNLLPGSLEYGTGRTPDFDKSKCVRLIAGNQYQFSVDEVVGATSWRFVLPLYYLDGRKYTAVAQSAAGVSTVFSQISYSCYYDGNVIVGNSNNTFKSFTFTPAQDMYLRIMFRYGDTTTSTIMTNPCLHLVWSGYRNGEYEEHWSSQRPIDTSQFFPTGLKKVSDKYDKLYADHYDTVIGSVDLGTLTWTYNSSYATPFFHTPLAGLNMPTNSEGMKSALYTAKNGFWGYAGNDMCIASGGTYLNVSNSAYTDAATFKTAMSGVILYYELATPTTTSIDPPLNLSYKVSDFGTERIMVDETADAPQSAPVPMDVEYGLNAIDTIRRLPTNYIPRDELESMLDEKADIDGYYAEMTVGAADNLTGRGDGVAAKYLYRTAGGDEDIVDGVATVHSIKGNTLVWNQFAPAYDSTVWHNYSNTMSSFTRDSSSESITLTSINDSTGVKAITMHGLTVENGHKYYISSNIDARNIQTTTALFGFFRADNGNDGRIVVNSGDVGRYAGIVSPTVATHAALKIGNTTPNGESATFSNIQCIDLTQMFGAGNEPSTVAEFEALFPKPYYPYSEPTLLSVNMEGIDTVGFNQWDEEWEVGSINDNDGQDRNDVTNSIRSKGYTPVFPSTQYYVKTPENVVVHYYTADKSWISRTSGLNNTTITTPANCRFIRFRAVSTYGTTYKGDICINLSWSGYRNGEYEEYWKSQRAIPAETYFPDGMRSVGSVADELTPSKAITRIGVVDLGTLDWNNYAVGSTVVNYPNVRYALLPSSATGFKSANVEQAANANLVLQNETSTLMVYQQTSVLTSYQRVYISSTDLAGKTAAQVKEYVAGIVIYYALAEPTEVDIEPPLNLSYKVSDFGTEKVMVDEEADAPQSAPPTIQVVYGINATDTVRRLPTQYISHDSFQQFVSALQSAVGITVTETWDETDGRYEYTVTQTGE